MIVSNLMKIIGNKEILKDISFMLFNSDKIGLVGSNGVGKSTLLKIISGTIKPDFGSVKLEDETVGFLKQEISYDDCKLSIIDYIKKETKISELEEKLHELENKLNENNMNEYGEVLNIFLSMDGYSFEDKLKMILSGLNFKADINTIIQNLFGGEKMKVLLAALLLKNPDILLLDEPTNNLDIKAIEWLENYLKSSNKKMIIVSHDEEFLNNIANKIYELKDGKIKEYNLSYDDYLTQKEIEYNHMKEEYLRAQEKLDKLKIKVQKAKEWVNKGTNKKAHDDNDKIANNFAKEITKSSNVSKLSKELKEFKMPNYDMQRPINVSFLVDKNKGNKDIVLEKLVCGYKNFRTPEFNLCIPLGLRLKISGENGSGKTTLINTILGEIKPICGNVRIGNDAKIGYISQNTLNNKTSDSIYKYLISQNESVNKSQIFMLLDKFDIKYEDKDKAYLSLSPGERTRVNLAELALNGTNILILDEVTNHLDSEALNLIYELIETYEGTIISISHNRKYNYKLKADLDLDVKKGIVTSKCLEKHR